ncbi:unnamed protein product [Eruca vesicaria subsp. sativa]|uniref:Ubiquitin-like protease family profile domain-containing protein n=1 Tax=Eruca vesicaria subsp. sativa TaxID=29727 RepID=A0ABC8LE25_ERUVS|nr:unnamed protein product [Eruca vesicaria subsp. sativa]
MMELIRTKHDFSDHVWGIEETPEDESAVNDDSAVHDEAAESDEDYHTPKGSKNLSATSSRGKKRLPDRGFLWNGQRLQKQMAETFEKMKTELEDSRKEPSVEVEPGESSPKEPSTKQSSPKKPSPKKPSPTKPSTSQPPLRRSTHGEASKSSFDVNFSEEDDIPEFIDTQGVEGLSQTSYVPGFDPSQTNKRNEWWTPGTSVRDSEAPLPSQWQKWNKGKGLQLTDSPLRTDGSPQSSLYYGSEESWIGFTEWVKKPKPLPLGPSILNLPIATRIVTPGKWLGNEEMDAFMFIWRVNTTLKRWGPGRVAFMSAMFCLQIDAAYNKFIRDKKAYELPEFLLGYGRGELPSHGRTDLVWGVDIDRLYFPLFVNGNHWVGFHVNIIEKKVEVLDSGRGRNRQHVEKFAALIPRIVKAVGPPERQKQLLLKSYSIVDVLMKTRLNKSYCDCGAYALKHLECLLLGIDLSLVDDEIIMGCRQEISVDLWESAHDPIYAEAMTRYEPSPWEREESFELED